jgi:hypothetical protein
LHDGEKNMKVAQLDAAANTFRPFHLGLCWTDGFAEGGVRAGAGIGYLFGWVGQ